MKSYEETEDGVTLHFDHGQPPVHAKLVVGADGYFSKVRTQCLNDGPPDFVVSSRAAMWAHYLIHARFAYKCTLCLQICTLGLQIQLLGKRSRELYVESLLAFMLPVCY